MTNVTIVDVSDSAAVRGDENVFISNMFVICESCYWAATMLRTSNGLQMIKACPLCSSNDKKLSFIPLAKGELYRFSISPKGGLEMEFSTRDYGRP